MYDLLNSTISDDPEWGQFTYCKLFQLHQWKSAWSIMPSLCNTELHKHLVSCSGHNTSPMKYIGATRKRALIFIRFIMFVYKAHNYIITTLKNHPNLGKLPAYMI